MPSVASMVIGDGVKCTWEPAGGIDFNNTSNYSIPARARDVTPVKVESYADMWNAISEYIQLEWNRGEDFVSILRRSFYFYQESFISFKSGVRREENEHIIVCER